MEVRSLEKKDSEKEISFLGKVFLFFKSLIERVKDLRIPQRIIAREKRLAGYENVDSPKEAKLSFVFGMSKISAIALLVIFLVVVVVFGGSMIAYDNVYYMFRDIAYINSFSESRPQSLNYSRPFENQDFTAFKNGLAVAGDSEIKLFTSTGRATMVKGSDYTNPKICSSDSTVLVYDQGRRSFSVYNSFVVLYSETLDYPISSAHMSPDGSFCIVTRSDEYGSVIRVYDNKFRLESEILRNDYVISAEINGNSIAVASLNAVEGEGVTTLTVVSRGREKARSSVELRGAIPYAVSFIANNRVAVICSDSSYVYDLDGNIQYKYSFPSRLINMSVNDGGFALLFSDRDVNSGYILQIFGENGNLVNSFVLSGQVSDIEYCGNFAFVMFDSEVKRIDTLFGTTSSVKFSEEDARLISFSDGTLMACTDTVAYYISFN